MTFDQFCDDLEVTDIERKQLVVVLADIRRRRTFNVLTDPPSHGELQSWVAAIGVGIGADHKTLQGLKQAAKIGWERGSGRKWRLIGAHY